MEEKVKFHRPPNNDDFKQGKVEKDVLSFVCLYGYSNATAYALFHPELCDRDGKLNKAGQRECRMFFSHPNNIAYMNALKAHLSAVTKGMAATSSGSMDLSDERIDKAFRAFLEQAIRDIENGKEIDNDTFKILMELFKKLGRFKDDVEQEMRPIRALPSRCSECRYRIGVESAVADGSMLDMCAYCKCRNIAEEHGYRFNDGKDLLEIPQEVIDGLESKNNVRLEDILSGKIEN